MSAVQNWLRPQLLVTITTPNGYRLDVTSRLGDVGTLSESVESDLLELVHGDIDLELWDEDGEIEALLINADQSDVYEVEILVDTWERRGVYLLFAGVISLKPGEVTHDRKEKTTSIQVQSYSRILELASAETIRRTVTGRIGSVTAGNDVITVNDSTDLEVGDLVRLENPDDPEQSEEQRILSFDDSTHVRTVENFEDAFTDATLTLSTPYLRNQTIAALAALLFEEAGITAYEINVDHDLATYPIATDINDTGLGTSLPKSIVEVGDLIKVAGTASTRRTATSPQSGFIAAESDTDGQGDWRPYLTAEPGSLQETTGYDTGGFAWDHTNSHRYNLLATVDPHPGGTTLDMRKDGVTVDNLDTFADPGDEGYLYTHLEYEPTQDQVWASWKRVQSGTKFTKVYDVATDATTSPALLAAGVKLRMVRPLGWMAALSDDGILHFYDPSTKTEASSFDTGLEFDDVRFWTLRVIDQFLAVLYVDGATTRLRVWALHTWEQVGDYEIAKSSASPQLLTAWTPSTGVDLGIGYAGGRYFVLSKTFAGVVPYADFDGLSCAGALRELAIISMSLVRVDSTKQGFLRGRAASDAGVAEELPTPLERETEALWDAHRTAVVVTGKTEDGEEIEEPAGATGDPSATQEEIDSQLITSSSLAQAVGALYVSWLGALRSQESVRIPANLSDLIRPFRRVRLDNVQHLVTEAETDIDEMEQDLVLVKL